MSKFIKVGSDQWWLKEERLTKLKNFLAEGHPYIWIANKFGFVSTTPITRAVKSFNINISNRNRAYALKYERDKLCNKNSKINTPISIALAPLNLTPDIIILRYGTRNNLHYYVPEIGKFVCKLSLIKILNRIGIQYSEWICKWFLKLPLSCIGSYEWCCKMIETFYDNYPIYTKNYISKKLLEDHNYIFTDYLYIDDILVNLIESWKDKLDQLEDFDFSCFPETISSTNSELIIIKKSTNTKYYTDYRSFVQCAFDPTSKCAINRSKNIKDKFYKKQKELWGTRFELLSEYHKNTIPIKIKCNNCGTIFSTTPSIHLSSREGGCPNCSKQRLKEERAFTVEDVQRIIDETYGENKYRCISDYKNAKTNIDILDVESGRVFKQKPENIFYHKIVDPENTCRSIGEYFTEQWLKTKNFVYKSQVLIKEIQGRTKNSNVIIDFIIYNSDNTEIWIEVNGRQHYDLTSSFGSEEGFKRDDNVREYCRNNKDSIRYIELPYILGSYSRVTDFLNKTIIDGIDPNTLIDYNKLFK